MSVADALENLDFQPASRAAGHQLSQIARALEHYQRLPMTNRLDEFAAISIRDRAASSYILPSPK